jgi:phosphoribosylanthranilate isomerase
VRTRVKICGITRAEDAGLAAAAGADAIGFVFWPKSPRAVTPAQAAAIWTAGALIARVGVFVNESPAVVRDIVRDARLTAVQLHGDEQVEEYLSCGAPLIKAVSLSDAASVSTAAALPGERDRDGRCVGHGEARRHRPARELGPGGQLRAAGQSFWRGA